MSRDVVTADVEHYQAAVRILVQNYPIEFVRSTLQMTVGNLEHWYEDEEEAKH